MLTNHESMKIIYSYKPDRKYSLQKMSRSQRKVLKKCRKSISFNGLHKPFQLDDQSEDYKRALQFSISLDRSENKYRSRAKRFFVKGRHIKQKSTNYDSDEDNTFKKERMYTSVPATTDIHDTDKDWTIMVSLKSGDKYETVPLKYDGYLMKRRKWPMKGWHKRFFVLENGHLTYARTPGDIEKKKFHGQADLGFCYITYKNSAARITIDDNLTYIMHLKEKNKKCFQYWIKALCEHRYYRQHQINISTEVNIPSPLPSLPSSKRGSMNRKSSVNTQAQKQKLNKWLNDDSTLNTCSKDLQYASNQIHELGRILERLNQNNENQAENMFIVYNKKDSNISEKTPSPPSPSFSGKSKRFYFKQQKNEKTIKKNKKSNSSESAISNPTNNTIASSTSYSHNFSNSIDDLIIRKSSASSTRPVSYHSGVVPDNNNEEFKFKEDFLEIARAVHTTFTKLIKTVNQEKEKLVNALDNDDNLALDANIQVINSLKQALNEITSQNEEYKQKLSNMQESSVDDLRTNTIDRKKLLANSLSLDSASVLEFYDAMDTLPAEDVSDNSSTETEGASDSESDSESRKILSDDQTTNFGTGRRTVLPVPQTFIGMNLWGILSNNIGKDLSKLSMPVQLNEPLGTLQRLCEELEYSDLIDKAAIIDDPIDRMVHLIAFAVSTYAYTFHRPKQKPFNPMLGETYECIREDMGWKFLAEQVSHHPPISAVHCISKHFTYWLDLNIKMKLYGRSCEIEPSGIINLQLAKYKEHYKWNKVKTCIHNLMLGECWIEHEGLINMTCSNGYYAKICFKKSGWRGKKHQVIGQIFSPDHQLVQDIFGKWTEGIYCGTAPLVRCIWRPGTLPEDSQDYFNFSRFTIELNEIDESERNKYAPTDTRFRPDQRALEEGRLQEAEAEKSRIEHAQRERRKRREENCIEYKPFWFKVESNNDNDNNDLSDSVSNSNNSYAFTGKYWDCRRDNTFKLMNLPNLWTEI